MCGSIQLIAYERSRASGHEGHERGWMSSATALTPTGTDDVRLQRSSDAEYQYVLLDEANHRIKNNLQIVQALLETARRETCNLEAQAVLSDAVRRIAGMGMAQQVLFGASNSPDCDARSLIETVCDTARISFGKDVIISSDVIAGRLAKHAAAPLALILNELLTNAAKHGTAGRDEVSIRVKLTEHAGGYELSVHDDGPGFDFGDFRRRSAGLGLVTALSRQIGGTFTVECSAGALCTVKFRER